MLMCIGEGTNEILRTVIAKQLIDRSNEGRHPSVQPDGVVEVPGPADFNHVVLAGQCGRERLEVLVALHDAPYRVINLRHATGDHERHRFHGSVASNGHRHHGMSVRLLRHFAHRFDRCVGLDLPGPSLRVPDEFDIGVAAPP